MFRHRFRTRPAAAPPSPAAFVLCPLPCLPPGAAVCGDWRAALYQWAFAEAQSAVRPSLPERDLLAAWN